MQIENVESVLPEGLSAPVLNVLTADANNYSALILQSRGDIEARNTSIQSQDRKLVEAQFGQFLENAVAAQPDLVITPEYSMPWEVLTNAIRDEKVCPAEGKLWVLGCESIRYSELQRLKSDLGHVAEVLFEQLDTNDEKFLDPLAYVFRAPAGDGSSKLVVLVQFKTCPMVDGHDFERNRLQTGKQVYKFGTTGETVTLLTFICSDFLAVDDQIARKHYRDALILNIQLLGQRQHNIPLDFRGRFLGLSGDSTELITINWARGTKIFVENSDAHVGKCGGSAWYLKSPNLDLCDRVVASNHRKGLYYTWSQSRRTHVAFFNFSPATFRLTTSKVVRIGVPAPAGQRLGPKLDTAETWDAKTGWTEVQELDDGFSLVCTECGGACDQIRTVYNACPVAGERLISLCAGDGVTKTNGYAVSSLISFGLPEDELIRRLTFCQPGHSSSIEFRRSRYRRCGQLWNALNDVHALPAALSDASNGFTLIWSSDSPYQNLQAGKGAATVVFADIMTQDEAESIHGAIRKRLSETLPPDADGEEHMQSSAHHAMQRIALWYNDSTGIRRLFAKTPRINDELDDSTDIRRTS